MHMVGRVLSVLAIAGAVSACASPEDMSAVETTADTFHTHLAAGDAKALHDGAAEAYRSITSFEQTERLVTFFKPRLAPCDAPTRIKNNVSTNYSTSGNFVTVVYERKCPVGPVIETLTVQIKDGVGLLAGFNISGDQIMVDPAATDSAPSPTPDSDANAPAPADPKTPI